MVGPEHAPAASDFATWANERLAARGLDLGEDAELVELLYRGAASLLGALADVEPGPRNQDELDCRMAPPST